MWKSTLTALLVSAAMAGVAIAQSHFFDNQGNGTGVYSLPPTGATLQNVTLIGSIVAKGNGFVWLVGHSNPGSSATVLNKISDRLLVGQAAALNDTSTTPPDWLGSTTNWAYLASEPQLLSISTNGTTGITGASRSSDSTAGGVAIASTSIGIAGACLNDLVGAGNCWGAYFEARRTANTTGPTYGFEADVTNSKVDFIPQPYTLISGVNSSTYDGVFACGAGLTPPYPCAAAIAISNNSQTWNKGIVFANAGLTPGQGAGGNGVAIEMASGQTVRWIKSDGSTLGEVWADANGMHFKPPTSCTGQASGSLWNNAGTPAIC